MHDRLRMTNSGNLTIHRQLFDSTLSRTIDAIYIILSAAVIVCNSLTCFMFYRNKSLRKPFSILLLNLSLADIVSAFSIQPYIWIDFTKLGGNSASRFLCASSVGMIFFMSSSLTNGLTLTTITIVRYLGIVRNYQGRIVTSRTIVISFCVMTWVIGAASSILSGLSFQYNNIQAICYREWPNGTNGNLYSLTITVMFFALPVLIMIICYASLIVHIWKRSSEAPGRNIAAVRARKSIGVLVGLLILALILCWTPFFTTWTLGRAFNYFPEGADGEYERQRWLRVTAIFALLNSVLDPFIYTLFSQEYRNSMVQLICDPWKRKEPSRSTRAYTVST